MSLPDVYSDGTLVSIIGENWLTFPDTVVEVYTFMRLASMCALASVLLVTTSAPALTPKVRRGPTAPRLTKPTPKPKTAQGIDSARATPIPTALIKAGYMTGTPSGIWDAQTQAAMEKLQSGNGWQTKLVPDSRALIKLGLGNSYSPATVLASQPAEQHESPESSAPATIPASQ